MKNRKKGSIILVVAIVIIIIVGVIVGMSLFSKNVKGYIPNNGVVPDEETAIKIAEAVWLPIYGEHIYSNQPFMAIYNETERCWYVKGSLPETTVGGVPEIIISKSDGKILYINHGK